LAAVYCTAAIDLSGMIRHDPNILVKTRAVAIAV
jgi:hypothetical protein